MSISEQSSPWDEHKSRTDGTVFAKSIFAERLKVQIEKKGWSLRRTAEEAARFLDDGAKFGPAHVWHYLQARTLPRQRYLNALSHAFGIGPDDLMPHARPRRRTPPPRTDEAFAASGARLTRKASSQEKAGTPAQAPGARETAARTLVRGASRDQKAGGLTVVKGGAGATVQPLVLIVSNDFAMQRSVESTLRTYGYEVVRCGTHQEALQQVRRGRIGVLVADLDSEAADRLSLVRAARQADPRLPVIYTVDATAVLLAGERVAGAPCLRTPYHPHQLLNLVRQLARRASQEPESHAA